MAPEFDSAGGTFRPTDADADAGVFKAGDLIDDRYRVIKCEHWTKPAHVYLVETDDPLHKKYWIKVFAKAYLTWKREQERIKNELRVLAALTHPFFIHPIRTGQLADGRQFILVEFADGELLLNAIEAPKYNVITVERAVGLALQLVHAVTVAYKENKVIHGALNPRAMYVRQTGHLLIFGLEYAKIAAEDQDSVVDATPSQLPEEVLRYAAPEVAADPRCADPSSELYSIAGILYFAVTGEPPIPGHNKIQVRTAVNDVVPMPPRKRRPDAGITPLLEEIILCGLAKSRDERFKTLRELHDALLSVQWEFMSSGHSARSMTRATEFVDMQTRDLYVPIGTRLVEQRHPASTSLHVPMRNLWHLMREEQPHLRRLRVVVDELADQDSTALTDEEKAIIKELRKKESS